MLPSRSRDEIYINEYLRWHIQGTMQQLNDFRSSMFDITPIHSDQNTGFTNTRWWFDEGCEFLSAEEDATLTYRTKAQAEKTASHVLLNRCLYGTLRGEILDHAIENETLEIYLYDEGIPGATLSTRSAFQGILIPKTLLGFDPSRHAPVIRLSKSPIVRDVLHADFDQIFEGLVQRNTLDRFRFQRMIATIKVAIGSEQQDGDVRRRARENVENLICNFIEQRLDDPDLSVEMILRNFGVSRASLYRMFEPRGGVRNYIGERRVMRAVIDLAERPVVRGKISTVSEKWGFPSMQQFNRSVRRQFGVAPSALLDASA